MLFKICSRLLVVCAIALPLSLCGCGKTSRDLALDAQLARASLDRALKSWVDGQQPADLQPEITIGDYAWNAGKRLVSYEIRQADEHSDGTNLYIPVVCQFRDTDGKVSKSETIYVVGTSPVVTIFPQ